MESTISIKKRSLIGLTAAAFATVMVFMSSTAIVGASKSEAAKAAKPGKSTITQIVLANDGEFDVLQAAVVRAGLADALNGKRQFTVFAPTDAAFVKTLEVANEAAAIDAVNALPIDTLTDILLYHVTSGRKISTSVLASPSQQMLNGDKLPIDKLLDAGIFSTDLSASNGVIHVINSVLMP